MSNETDKQMQRLIETQMDALAKDPDYPLNDFKNKMKVGNIPTASEREQLTRDLYSGVRQFEDAESDSVLNEAATANSSEKNAALGYQRAIINKLKENGGKAPLPKRQTTPNKASKANSQELSMLAEGKKVFAALDSGYDNDDGEYTQVDMRDKSISNDIDQVNTPISFNDDDDCDFEPITN